MPNRNAKPVYEAPYFYLTYPGERSTRVAQSAIQVYLLKDYWTPDEWADAFGQTPSTYPAKYIVVDAGYDPYEHEAEVLQARTFAIARARAIHEAREQTEEARQELTGGRRPRVKAPKGSKVAFELPHKKSLVRVPVLAPAGKKRSKKKAVKRLTKRTKKK